MTEHPPFPAPAQETPVRVIGVSGGSGSGKTTLAAALTARLPQARALREDDYYHCSSAVPGFDARTYNFDHIAAKDFSLLAAHLSALRAGEAIEKPLYDFVRHRREAVTETLSAGRFVVVEGIHALAAPAVRPLLDLAVYLDTPDDVRLARRLLRDVRERGRTLEDVLDQYMSTVRPMHAAFTAPSRMGADLVLAEGGAAPGPERLASLVVEEIQARGWL